MNFELYSAICTLNPAFQSSAAFAEENNTDGFEENSEVKEEGHVLDVKEVILKFLGGVFN